MVAAVVAVSLILGGAALPGGADPEPSATVPPVVVATVPTPQIAGQPAVDGSTVTFTFTNPEPKDGDVFVWQISNRTDDEPTHKAEGNAVVVTDYAPGSTVCVKVSVLRSGKTSANTYETCYPQ